MTAGIVEKDTHTHIFGNNLSMVWGIVTSLSSSHVQHLGEAESVDLKFSQLRLSQLIVFQVIISDFQPEP